MECPPGLEELLKTVFNLSGREIDVLMALCDEELSVQEIAEEIGRDRSTVQRYLDGLRKTGLIERSRNGRKHLYRVDRSELREQVQHELDAWVQAKEQALDEL